MERDAIQLERAKRAPASGANEAERGNIPEGMAYEGSEAMRQFNFNFNSTSPRSIAMYIKASARAESNKRKGDADVPVYR
jgi:hypothetical protein